MIIIRPTPSNTPENPPSPTPTLPPEDVSAIEESVMSYIEEEGIEIEDNETISIYYMDEGYALVNVSMPDESYEGVIILEQDGDNWNVIAGPDPGGFAFEELEELGLPESVMMMAVEL